MPEITRLANGVRILTETLAHVRSVSLGIWVRTGSRQDPVNRSGIAHFTEHMLFKGTPSRGALQIAKDIDALGGVLNAQTAKEYTVYYVKVLDEHLLEEAVRVSGERTYSRAVSSDATAARKIAV